jgi:hypothetical protein
MDQSQPISICTKSCPTGYYGNSVNGYCYACAIQCATCIYEPNKCIKCNSLLKYTKVKPDSYDCVPLVCKEGTFENLIDGEYVCSKCHPNCKACIGPESTECLQCLKPIGYISESSKIITQKDTFACFRCEEYDARLVSPSISEKIACSGNIISRMLWGWL